MAAAKLTLSLQCCDLVAGVPHKFGVLVARRELSTDRSCLEHEVHAKGVLRGSLAMEDPEKSGYFDDETGLFENFSHSCPFESFVRFELPGRKR